MSNTNNIFVYKIDFGNGNGYINFYQATNINKITNLASKRGIEKIVIRLEDNETYKEYTLKELKEIYN